MEDTAQEFVDGCKKNMFCGRSANLIMLSNQSNTTSSLIYQFAKWAMNSICAIKEIVHLEVIVQKQSLHFVSYLYDL